MSYFSIKILRIFFFQKPEFKFLKKKPKHPFFPQENFSNIPSNSESDWNPFKALEKEVNQQFQA